MYKTAVRWMIRRNMRAADGAVVVHGWYEGTGRRCRAAGARRVLAAWPPDLAPDRDSVNGELHAALRRHARERYGTAGRRALERTIFALVDIPGAPVHRFLDRHQPPPDWSIEAVGVAALAVLRAPFPEGDHQ